MDRTPKRKTNDFDELARNNKAMKLEDQLLMKNNEILRLKEQHAVEINELKKEVLERSGVAERNFNMFGKFSQLHDDSDSDIRKKLKDYAVELSKCETDLQASKDANRLLKLDKQKVVKETEEAALTREHTLKKELTLLRDQGCKRKLEIDMKNNEIKRLMARIDEEVSEKFYYLI